VFPPALLSSQSHYCYFCGAGAGAQGLTIAMPEVNRLSHAPSPYSFLILFFRQGLALLLSLASNYNHPTSVPH
jgi:hypothetical protein